MFFNIAQRAVFTTTVRIKIRINVWLIFVLKIVVRNTVATDGAVLDRLEIQI